MWDFLTDLARLAPEQRKAALEESDIWLNHSTFREIVMNLPKPERLTAFKEAIARLNNQA